MRGPVPKRSDQRRRRNKEPEDKPALLKVVPDAKPAAVKPPAEDVKWHPYAKQWFRSLKRSEQSKFYQDSDWQEARLVALLLTIELKRQVPRAGMIDVLFSRADNLLTTEGARRRLRVEIQTLDEANTEQQSNVASAFAAYAALAPAQPGA